MGIGLANQCPTMGAQTSQEIRKDTPVRSFDTDCSGTNIPRAPINGHFYSALELMDLARSRREADEVTYKQLATDVALCEASKPIKALAKAANMRYKRNEVKIAEDTQEQDKTNNDNAIPGVDTFNLKNLKNSLPVDHKHHVYGTAFDHAWLNKLDSHPKARVWLESNYPSLRWSRFTKSILRNHRTSAKFLFIAREWFGDGRDDSVECNGRIQRNLVADMGKLRKGYAVRTAGAKAVERDTMALMWAGSDAQLTLVDEDGDVIMDPRPKPPLDFVYRAGEYGKLPVNEEVADHMVIDEIVEEATIAKENTDSTTLSWEQHKNPDWGEAKYAKVGMRSWFDWMGITKFQNSVQTSEDAAIGAAALLAYDAMDDEHVDVKPVVKTWDYLKGRVAGVFGKRKYSVLHRSANRFNRRVAVVKTLVAELRANAPGVFTKSEADKRALHLCAKQIVEKAWKEGVEIGVDCELRKIRRNERAYYLHAVCTAYHLGDDDSAFWKALESAPDPHQA